MSDHIVGGENKLEVEINKMKRRWLASFSRPKMLMKDVCDLLNGSAYNDMSAREDPVPDSGIFMYFFGFSCKDLSTLNNHSAAFKDDCITTGAGSTGVTWAGNLGFVEKVQPAVVIAENVPSALKGGNGKQIQQDLRDAGYRLATILSSSSDCGLPQDRKRAWFAAVRNDLAPDNFESLFHDGVDMMTLAEPLPLSKFVLPCTDPYIERLMDKKRQNAALKRMRQNANKDKKKAKAKAKGKAKAKQQSKEPTKKRSGDKWMFDHWRVRRQYDMPVVDDATIPDMLKNTACENAMCSREADLLRLYLEAPVHGSKPPHSAVELKHSAPRVVHHSNNAKREHCTSTLLPGSKIMLFPPLTRRPRYICCICKR